MNTCANIDTIILTDLNEIEFEELCGLLQIAGTDPDWHIVNYAERLNLKPYELRNWWYWLNGGREE